MSREINSTLLELFDRDTVYPFFAVKLEFQSETIRMWTGVNSLVIDGATYLGLGELLQISEVEESSEMSAKAATLTLSGVPSDLVSLALSEPYQGRAATFYFGAYDSLAGAGDLLEESSTFLLLQDGSKIDLESNLYMSEIFSGYMDTMEISESASSSTIALSVVNKLVDLERLRISRYNSATQKEKYPGDKGFDFVESLQDKEVFWGRANPA